MPRNKKRLKSNEPPFFIFKNSKEVNNYLEVLEDQVCKTKDRLLVNQFRSKIYQGKSGLFQVYSRMLVASGSLTTYHIFHDILWFCSLKFPLVIISSIMCSFFFHILEPDIILNTLPVRSRRYF